VPAREARRRRQIDRLIIFGAGPIQTIANHARPSLGSGVVFARADDGPTQTQTDTQSVGLAAGRQGTEYSFDFDDSLISRPTPGSRRVRARAPRLFGPHPVARAVSAADGGGALFVLSAQIGPAGERKANKWLAGWC
jgi:hypothetical protein